MRSIGAMVISVLTAVGAASADSKVDYDLQVKPLLREHCFACHGALKQEGGLRLDSGDLIRRGGDSGPAVQPGDARQSQILQRVTAEDDSIRMPQQASPLKHDEIELLRAWIEKGAPFPANDQPEKDPRQHWAFQRPVRPPVPDAEDGVWSRNPVDAFIAAGYRAHGLSPVAETDKGTLLRRLFIDLIGLPPPREALRAFLADTSPNAYERIVDRLLASPQYGERWGRHWMDVWRYSDWYGRRSVNDVRNSYPHIWRWRDWIVRSINADVGYDRMIMEMLAGDEIAPANDDTVVATGFIVRNWYSLNYDVWMQDLVEHTSKAFLGIRINCAHCHDHKYDPITQREYFQFRAFFEPMELRHDRVPGGPPLERFKKYVPGSGASLAPIEAGLARVFDAELDTPTYMYHQGDARDRFQNEPPVSPAAPAILGGDSFQWETVDLPPIAFYPGLKPFVRQAELARCEQAILSAETELADTRQRDSAPATPGAAADAALSAAAQQETTPQEHRTAELAMAAAQAKLDAARTDLKALKSRIAADDARFLDGPGDAQELARDAFRLEQEARLAASRSQLASAEHAQEVAQDDKARQKAAAQIAAAKKAVDAAMESLQQEGTDYTPLAPLYPTRSSGRRAALARWIASGTNPLTARVAVNHVWMRHFGAPLVESTYDFGRSGAQPTHPELLDWLAVELIDSGWSMKRLHRLIVTSQTYRLRSESGDDGRKNAAADPHNRYWWRFGSRRAEAEVVRDGMLSLGGRLDCTMGGPEIDNKLESDSPRRSMYFTIHPSDGGAMQFLKTFDAADPLQCYRRAETIVPQQALALSNSEFSIDVSRLLARRLTQALSQTTVAEKPQDRDFIQAAFEHILSRVPKGEEFALCEEFLGTQRALFAGDDMHNGKESGESAAHTMPDNHPDMRARASLVHALFSHNDYVTIR